VIEISPCNIESGKVLKKFKEIFSGLETSYGITTMTGEIRDDGKNEAESKVVHKPVTDELWKKHLDGLFPALGIMPIRADNKCKWGCIDIDVYDLNHKELIDKIKQKNLPLIVFKSKSGGAHVFLFCKEYVAASLVRQKLKAMAALIGHSNRELYPKQDYVRADKGQVGSWLNVPYHGGDKSVRCALDDNAIPLSLEKFFRVYDNISLTEKDLIHSKIIPTKEDDNDLLKGAPPCLITLLSDGVPKGKRNDTMFNVGVYLRKRFPKEWKGKMNVYNQQFMKPPLDDKEIEDATESLNKKEYRYKCKQEPILSFCESKICVKREFGVGDNVPPPEITRIEKFPSDPPIYIVTIDGKQVEVDKTTLHDFEKFSIEAMDQLHQVLLPMGKIVWRKILNKIMGNKDTYEVLPAPETTKIDYQFKELLADFINKAPGKEMKDVKINKPFTEDGYTYFKNQALQQYLGRHKHFTLAKNKTQKMLQDVFKAVLHQPKIDGKTVRVWKIPTIDLDKPIIRDSKLKDAPFK